MKTHLLNIQPLSPLLTSSGQGAALVDADAVFHPSGFPYIPARRIKGLLRESLTEVLEIMGMAEGDISENVNRLFGQEGADHNNGKLAIGNAYVSPWKDILQCISSDTSITADDVRGYLAMEIQQTAIEEGTAKDRSLRNYRVIQPLDEVRFVSPLSCMESLNKDELDWLRYSVSNLRYVGSRRNRGFGHVKCTLQDGYEESLGGDSIAEHHKEEIRNGLTGLRVSLRTDSSIIISRQDGDNNTLQTDDVVSGSQLRGALARLFMRKKGLANKPAHRDTDFHAIFLSGRLYFGHLHHRDAKPMPSFVHKEKYSEGSEGLNVFQVENIITKSVGGFALDLDIAKDGTAVIPKVDAPTKTSQFHNSRPDRSAGRNTGGQLFYYESLDEGQVFNGRITGDADILKTFCRHFAPEESLFMGRSKSAQYGRVTVDFTPEKEEAAYLPSEARSFLLVADTPIVLTNDWGHPAMDESSIVRAIHMAFQSMALDIQVKEIRRVAGSIIHVEHYNGVWRAKNGKYPAYAGGTTFLVEFIGTQLPKRISMGRFKELGYGAVRLLPNMEKLRISKEVPITKSDDVQKPIVPTLVSLIREHAKRRLKLRELENFAISNAKKGNVKLNNHQCGRLEQLMTDSKNITQVHHWLDENKQKSIGEALIKAHLLYDFDKKPHAYIRSDIYRDLDWEYTRHFWRTFFAVLRKMNKN